MSRVRISAPRLVYAADRPSPIDQPVDAARPVRLMPGGPGRAHRGCLRAVEECRKGGGPPWRASRCFQAVRQPRFSSRAWPWRLSPAW